MSLELKSNHLELLKDRAFMLAKARRFFAMRDVLELDCPILSPASNIDDSIDPITVQYCQTKVGFLHTSPEIFMKKMLARGMGDCYFLGHVFRDHEKGNNHNIEFTMVEWYRLGLDYWGLINETIDFVKLFFDVPEVQMISYYDALLKYTGIDYTKASYQDLQSFIEKNMSIKLDFSKETFSDLLILIFTEKVEPYFKELEFVALIDYPKDQAALAKIRMVQGREVASRFELYYRGIELANGYDELKGDHELYDRYVKLNQKRKALNKKELPIDEQFIAANNHLPQCTGVAVGFDRLMMLRHENGSIHEAMALVD